MDLSETDIAWLAGLLEGEGCFGARVRPDMARKASSIDLKMCDRDVVERAAAMMGVECNPVMTPSELASQRDKGWTPKFAARVHGEKARYVMRLVLKYMGERRTKKILESLEDWT